MKTQSDSVIYQIPCECGKIYVGQAKVGINYRMKQHYKTITDDKDRNDKASSRYEIPMFIRHRQSIYHRRRKGLLEKKN
jgi:hypothetical protein